MSTLLVASRPMWEAWAIGIADAVAARADCTRRQVGAVILSTDRRVLAVGYNGAPAGRPGCLSDGACPRGQLTPAQLAPGSSYDTGAGACISLHAEQNALLYSSAQDRAGGAMAITCAPCDGCRRMLDGSGLAVAFWPTQRNALGGVESLKVAYLQV